MDTTRARVLGVLFSLAVVDALLAGDEIDVEGAVRALGPAPGPTARTGGTQT